jgi:3-isopropylmalate/(R)-2-methylmalate dehydratase large subunit
MGMTLTEKLICKRAEKEHAAPGDRVALKVNRFLLDERTFHAAVKQAEQTGSKRPKAAGSTVVALDQMVGICEEDRVDLIRKIRKYHRKWRLLRFYEWGEGGIETVLFPDGGMIRPGDSVVGGIPAICSFGALGALALCADVEELFQAMMRGRIPFEVPETVRILFHGTPGHWVGGKDLAMHAVGLLGPGSMRGKAVEFGGEAIMNLDLSERLAAAAFAVHLGLRIFLIEPDEKTETFARARSDKGFVSFHNDEDAEFADVIEIDVNDMEPQIYAPSLPERVIKVSKARDMRVQQVIIGTGNNGRIEDIRIAASLLREHQIDRSVSVTLIPGSQQVYLHAMEEGLIQILGQAGTHIGLPSRRYSELCHLNGLVNEGMRCLSTSDRIYGEGELRPGREIVYCNPAVAASSAVMGRVVHPFEMLRNVKRTPTGLMG